MFCHKVCVENGGQNTLSWFLKTEIKRPQKSNVPDYDRILQLIRKIYLMDHISYA